VLADDDDERGYQHGAHEEGVEQESEAHDERDLVEAAQRRERSERRTIRRARVRPA
jgi:hypothetical protein